jgi:hypothetical protein
VPIGRARAIVVEIVRRGDAPRPAWRAIVPHVTQGQFPQPDRTAWHITIGTARARLHGGPGETVDRRHNKRGEAFVGRDPAREQWERERAGGEPVYLDQRHRTFIQATVPAICERGGWGFHACAAPAPPDNDHVHVLLDAHKAIHGKQIRMWLKRWLTEAMNAEFETAPDGGGSGEWWVDGGSTKPVKDAAYFANVVAYVGRQRTTAFVLECDKGASS